MGYTYIIQLGVKPQVISVKMIIEALKSFQSKNVMH